MNKPIKLIIGGTGAMHKLLERGFTIDKNIPETFENVEMLASQEYNIFFFYLPALDNMSIFADKKINTYLPLASYLNIDITEYLITMGELQKDIRELETNTEEC